MELNTLSAERSCNILVLQDETYSGSMRDYQENCKRNPHTRNAEKLLWKLALHYKPISQINGGRLRRRWKDQDLDESWRNKLHKTKYPASSRKDPGRRFSQNPGEIYKNRSPTIRTDDSMWFFFSLSSQILGQYHKTSYNRFLQLFFQYIIHHHLSSPSYSKTYASEKASLHNQECINHDQWRNFQSCWYQCGTVLLQTSHILYIPAQQRHRYTCWKLLIAVNKH
jgi:hypothetical protein